MTYRTEGLAFVPRALCVIAGILLFASFASPAFAEAKAEVEVLNFLYKSKGRLRDGEAGAQPVSFRYTGDGLRYAPDIRASLRIGGGWSTWFEAWRLSSTEGGEFSDAGNAGGNAVAAGTDFEADLSALHWEFGGRYRFDFFGESLRVFPGARIEFLGWNADYDVDGLPEDNVRWRGLWPNPSVDIEWEFVPDWKLKIGYKGFLLPFEVGDTKIVKPYQIDLGFRYDHEAWSFGTGYRLYHVHFEKDQNDVTEDVTHIRLRGIFFSVAYRF